ncbi:hypothetical protein C8T65DRAFT_697822 [Cerioporus squamosus]|nr:hypothetical protein C8T65DRAFT_697822 [Cerioporus squamosus]
MASLDRYLYGYTGISGAGTQAHPGIPPDKVQGAPPNKAQDQKPLPPSDHTQSGSDTTPISPPAPAEHVALADEGPGRDDHQAGSPPLLLPNDLVEAIPGLYRVLDLILDKVIIEQDALGRLINDLRPNAYTSMTKVDFRALDSVHVKPLGLYGSKSSIVEFLRKKCGLDEQLTAALLLPSDDVGTAARASLRSGLYILKLGDGDPMYVIYWPEDNTWEDNCAQSTHTSRVAFMRYLTKLCDQVACLMSADHANTIVWRQPDETADDDDLEVDESDRMFTFEVLKTKEQEENVSAKMGFEAREVHIPPIAHDVPTNADIDILPPRLTRGETQQGVVTAVHVPGKEVLIPSDKTWEETALKNLVRGPLQLNPAISADSLELLLRLGMRERSPDAVKQYRSRLVEVDGIFKTRLQERNREVSARIEGEAAGLSSSIARYLMRELVKKYPMLTEDAASVLRRDDALTPHDNNVQGASAAEGDAGDVNKVVELTNEHLSNVVLAKAKELSIKFQRLQHQTCHAQVRQEVDAEKTRALNEARMDLVQGLMRHTDDTAAGARSTAVVEILDVSEVQQPSSRFGGVRMYKVKSSEARYSPPEDRYTIYPLELAERDIHLMREGVSDHVPSPIVRTHSASAFSLPGNCEVVGPGDCLIYAPPVSAIDHAIRKKAVKKLSRDKLGDHFLLAYDETKRVLALCIMVAEEPLIHLHTFAFDQKYTSLQGRGSHVNLSTWYDSPVTIKHMEFVSGMEELLFVDDLSRARIFSLVSQQFRPARLQLSRDVLAVYPSPEGSCFFVTERSTDDGETFTFRAYHWSSFGSSEGIKIDTPSSFNHGLCHVVTSFFASSNVHLMGLDMVENLLRSISLPSRARTQSSASGRKATDWTGAPEYRLKFTIASSTVTQSFGHGSLLCRRSDEQQPPLPPRSDGLAV